MPKWKIVTVINSFFSSVAISTLSFDQFEIRMAHKNVHFFSNTMFAILNVPKFR